MSIFAERIALLMEKHNLNQSQLAKKANITEAAMSNYVKGVRTPNSDVLLRIAKILDTSTDYLLGKANADPSNEDLYYIQRNLDKLDPEQLKKAENILKSVFDDIWDDDEED
ncbi:MAG: helix-turn-helix transcriptional regulator [Clostridiales bacterium]|nr:helix-turn-helix transcriptional regulator [Clostridiales bacterium]